jgi:hypothetical protein
MLANQQSNFVNTDLRRFLGKPFQTFHIFSGRNSNTQKMRTWMRIIAPCFNGKDRFFWMGVGDNGCKKRTLSVNQFYFVANLQAQYPDAMFAFLFIKLILSRRR